MNNVFTLRFPGYVDELMERHGLYERVAMLCKSSEVRGLSEEVASNLITGWVVCESVLLEGEV